MPEDRQAGLVLILFDCTESLAHCARGCESRQPEFLCTAVQAFGNFGKLFCEEFYERISETMPNGFHGSAENWEKIEAPLRQIDRQLEEFAKAHTMSVRKNYHNWPERSLLWSSEGLRRLIQIYLKDDTKETYRLWLCASEDRGHERYWKQQFLLDGVTWAEVREGLEKYLDQAHKTVQAWSASDLEFGGKIHVP